MLRSAKSRDSKAWKVWILYGCFGLLKCGLPLYFIFSSFKLAMTDDVCRFFLILIGAHNGQSYGESYVTFM